MPQNSHAGTWLEVNSEVESRLVRYSVKGYACYAGADNIYRVARLKGANPELYREIPKPKKFAKKLKKRIQRFLSLGKIAAAKKAKKRRKRFSKVRKNCGKLAPYVAPPPQDDDDGRSIAERR